MKAKDQRMCISPYLRDEAFDQSGLKIRTREKPKRRSRPFVDIYVGEFRKIISKKAPIPRRHAPSLGTFSSKKMARCSIIKNVSVVELSVEIAISPAVFSLHFETDHSGWPTSSIVVLMMFDSGAKERLSQGTKVVSPSLNDRFLDLGLLQVSPNRRVLGYLSLRYLILALPQRCPSLTSTRIARGD